MTCTFRFHPTIAVLSSVLLGLTGASAADEIAPLTLDECVRRALANGFTMEIQRMSPELARNQLAVAESAFDPRLTTTLSSDVTQTAGGTTVGPRYDAIDATVGVTQLWPTGTSLSISTALDRTGTNHSLAGYDPLYSSDTILSVRQPLWQGADRRVITLARRSAEIGLANAERSLGGQVLETINSTENAFFLLVGAREQLKVVRTSLELSERLLREAQTREKAGVGTSLEIAQAEVGVANARSSVLQAEEAVQNAEDVLHSVIGRFEYGGPLGPAQFFPEEAPVLDESAVFTAAKGNQAAYLNSAANLELADLNVVAARDALKPSVSLDLAAGFNGDSSSGSDAYGRSFDRERTYWQVGLSWSRPWGRGAEKANYRSALTSRNQQELQFQQSEQTLLQRVRLAVRTVVTNQRGTELAATAVDVAEKQYALEAARFRQGLSTSRAVLQAQSDLEGARLRHVQARLTLQAALAAIRQLTGDSLTRYNVVVAHA